MNKLLLIFFGLISIANAQKMENTLHTKMYQAQLYLRGTKDIVPNEAQAFNLYLYCAEQGVTQAMLMTAQLYRDGRGVKPNFLEAAKWFAEAGSNGEALGWYHLGVLYKNADVPMQDFSKSFSAFEKGSLLDNYQCKYYKAYMLYKGFGCKQNYEEAATLFAECSSHGNTDATFYYAICLRNGYGLPVNEMAATNLLRLAASKGNSLAKKELNVPVPENAQSKTIQQSIEKWQTDTLLTANKYKRIEKKLSSEVLAGSYIGSLITYDWSGKQPIERLPVQLKMINSNGNLSGFIIQADTIKIPFTATISRHAIVFDKLVYARATHYSYNSTAVLQIDSAKLLWKQQNDSIYLAGNIYMNQPGLKEPFKPQYLSLVKYNNNGFTKKWVNIISDDNSALVTGSLKAWPNPFTDNITVDVEIKKPTIIITELKTVQGQAIYSQTDNLNQAGNYSMPLHVPQTLGSGTYILTIKAGKSINTIKITKN